MICLRIGFVTGTPRPDNGNWRRMWLSPTDLGHLVRTSLATLLHYGVSANKPLRYDLERPRKDFGYQPADDSTDF
jgi:hypothetical protein